MTIRKFWFGFFTYFTLFAAMVLCAFLFGRSTTAGNASGYKEEAFAVRINAIPPRVEAPFFALRPQREYTSFEEMMRIGQPNLIVRATLTRRLDCPVYDPHGIYSDASLGKSGVDLYLCTPYEVKIEEVLLGYQYLWAPGDTFTFYAPYGFLNGYAVRYADTPIFTVGREYYLFFSVVEVRDIGLWYDLVHPSAVALVMAEDMRTFSALTEAGARLFDDTEYDSETLADRIYQITNEFPYSINVPVITPMDILVPPQTQKTTSAIP